MKTRTTTRVHKTDKTDSADQTEPADVPKAWPGEKRATEFSEDWRKTNPGLHLLYVKIAVKHLVAIDDMLLKLNDFSNGNMMDIITALTRERAKLVTRNAAYADAAEDIAIIREGQEV